MQKRFLSENEESALLDAAFEGDNEAWGTLYNSFILPVRGFIAGRTGTLEDAEDLAQECFMRARKGLDDNLFDRQYRFYTYLRGIANHLVQNHWRHRSKMADHLLEHADREQKIQTYHQSSVEPFERLELLRLVFACGAKPHQILMFGFVKLLEWRPREIVREHSDSSLGVLADELLASYYAPLERFLSKTTFYDTYCSPLLDVVELLVRETYVEHEYSTLSIDTDSIVGSISLRVFFGRDPAASISDWCDRVRTRTRKLIAATNIKANDVSLPNEPGS